MNKKGIFRDIVAIGSFLLVLGIGFLILRNVGTTITDTLIANPTINASNGTVTALETINTNTARLDQFFMAIFIGFTIFILLSAWFIAGNPILMGGYIILGVISTALAPLLSNIWYDVSIGYFASELAVMPLTNFIILRLPYFLGGLVFLGAVIMFAKPKEDMGAVL